MYMYQFQEDELYGQNCGPFPLNNVDKTPHDFGLVDDALGFEWQESQVLKYGLWHCQLGINLLSNNTCTF